MRAFGSRPLTSITVADVSRFLRWLDAEAAMTARTVNKHRQLLCSIFKHAMREDTYRLPSNPAAATDRRREADDRPIDFYEPDEVLALARAAESGTHRDPSRPAVSAREAADRALADQPAAALARLSERDNFIGRDELVFCNAVGDYLDPSAIRRRYRRAQAAAGLRPLRFHDLRHSFGSLVIREFDPVSGKDFMGHSKITTTERYLHARSRRTDAARLTKAFGGGEVNVAVVT